MAKYKLINRSGLSSSFWVVDKIYDSDLRRDPDWNSVQDMANKYPNNWKLIQEKSSEELLLEEAKLRYPIGTKFYPAHISKNQRIFSLDKCISNGKFTFRYSNRSITVDDGINVDYGRSACPILYNSELNKWAEIIEDKMEKLPEKWCIKLVSREINDAVNAIDLCNLGCLIWEDTDTYKKCYVHSNGYYESNKLSDYTEITFDDF